METKHFDVSGIGVVSSIGKNLTDFSTALRQGQSGIGRVEYLKGLPWGDVIGADIKDFNFQECLKKMELLPEEVIKKASKCAGRSPFTVQTSVVAALEAWEQTGLYKASLDPERIGLVVCGHNISQRYHYETFLKYSGQIEYLNPRYALHYMDTDHVGTISEILDIKGEGFTVGGASATGNAGIIKGCQLLELDLVDICLVVAPPAELSAIEVQGFYNIGAMGGRRFMKEPEKACRPFDSEHEGFIYGQGAGCIILESTKSLERRKGKSFAEICGSAIALDANRLSDPNEKGEQRVMIKALDRAGLKVSDIDYINAHGSSSPLGDEVELRAIKGVFGENIKDIWINSTKSLTGHCLYSAALIEAIAVIVQMQGSFVHPNINLDNPIDSQIRFTKSTCENAEVKYAINNSFGFGGINTCVVFKKV